jgi:hypothetical protein
MSTPMVLGSHSDWPPAAADRRSRTDCAWAGRSAAAPTPSPRVDHGAEPSPEWSRRPSSAGTSILARPRSARSWDCPEPGTTHALEALRMTGLMAEGAIGLEALRRRSRSPILAPQGHRPLVDSSCPRKRPAARAMAHQPGDMGWEPRSGPDMTSARLRGGLLGELDLVCRVQSRDSGQVED